MKIDSPWVNKLGGLLGTLAVRAWMSTLQYKIAYYDDTVDPVFPQESRKRIYLLWHENILFPLYIRGHCDVAMLVSRHGDADILAEAVRHLGYECVRGSTFNGAGAGLRELMRKSRRLNLGLTPDGPRGPRRVMSKGPIYLASKLAMPAVAMGFGYDRPWRLGTWDRFAIPRPGTRARAVFGPAITIPPNLDRGGLEHYRLMLERTLNQVTDEAEAWATSGTGRIGEVPMRRKSADKLARQVDRVLEIPPDEPMPQSISLDRVISQKVGDLRSAG